MKIDFNSNLKTKDHHLTLELDEKDIHDADKIRIIMETEAWNILEGYWFLARQSIIEKLKNVSVSKNEAEMAVIRCSILKGFDECLKIPSNVVERARVYLDKSTDGRYNNENAGNDEE